MGAAAVPALVIASFIRPISHAAPHLLRGELPSAMPARLTLAMVTGLLVASLLLMWTVFRRPAWRRAAFVMWTASLLAIAARFVLTKPAVHSLDRKLVVVLLGPISMTALGFVAMRRLETEGA